MYLEHFGLTEAPFRITPHTEFFFSGANRGATLDALIYAITHDDGIVKVSGEVGSGKTMLCRVFMERLPEHVSIVYLANPSLPREDILYAISDELKLDLPERARPSTVQRTLEEQLVRLHGGGRLLWILDASINITMEPFRAFVGDAGWSRCLDPGRRQAGRAAGIRPRWPSGTGAGRRQAGQRRCPARGRRRPPGRRQ